MEINKTSDESSMSMQDEFMGMMPMAGKDGMSMSSMSMVMTFNTKLPLNLLFDELKLENNTGINNRKI